MKRLIVYVLAFALFFWVGLRQPGDMLVFAVFVGPYHVFGGFLRSLSEFGPWSNMLAIVIWLAVSFVPLGYLFYRIKSKIFKPIDLIMIIIAVSLGLVLYYAINPHLMVDHIDPRILESMTSAAIKDVETMILFGLLTTLYAPLLIYGILRFIHMKNMRIDAVLRLLVDLVAVMIILDYAGASLPGTIRSIQDDVILEEVARSLFSLFKETTLFVLMMTMVRFAFPVFTDFDIGNDSLYGSVQRLYGFSLIYLVTALAMVFTENALTFFLRKNLDHIHFHFDLPLFALMIASLLLLFGKYVLTSVELRRENELMI
jgi:hypothetical protein